MEKRLKDTKYKDRLPRNWLLAEEIEEALEKRETPHIEYDEDWELIAKCLKEYGQMPDKSGTFYV